VKDLWVLLELQRQSKLHRFPTGADEHAMMVQLARAEGSFIVTNDDLPSQPLEWTSSHLTKYFTFSLPTQAACAACTKMKAWFADSHAIVDRPGQPAHYTQRAHVANITKEPWKKLAERCLLSCLGTVVLVPPKVQP
jgi:hypothetical protein